MIFLDNPEKLQARWNAEKMFPIDKENEGPDTIREDVERCLVIIRKISEFSTKAEKNDRRKSIFGKLGNWIVKFSENLSKSDAFFLM